MSHGLCPTRPGGPRPYDCPMHRRLFHYYQRKRIININANIIAAGLLALIPTTGIVWLAKLFIDEDRSKTFTAISLVSDIVFDVIIYYALHWVANHWRPLRAGTERESRELSAAPPPFMRDASLIQFERALLSPLYYLTAVGLMQYLQDVQDVRPGFAVLIAYPAGLSVTRIVHTLWGLRSGTFLSSAEREAKRKAKAAARADAGGDEQAAA